MVSLVEEDARESGFEASALLPQDHQIFLPKISHDEVGEMNYQGHARKITTFDDYVHQLHLFHYKTTSDTPRKSRNGRMKDDDTKLFFCFFLPASEEDYSFLPSESILHEATCDETHETSGCKTRSRKTTTTNFDNETTIVHKNRQMEKCFGQLISVTKNTVSLHLSCMRI